MDGFLTYNNQINLVNSIVSSSKELMPVIRDKYTYNETIHSTLNQIFKFLHKILKMLPEFLVTKDYKFARAELISTFETVMDAWSKYEEDAGLFFQKWDEFVFWWEEFHASFVKVTESNSTIYLSMN